MVVEQVEVAKTLEVVVSGHIVKVEPAGWAAGLDVGVRETSVKAVSTRLHLK